MLLMSTLRLALLIDRVVLIRWKSESGKRETSILLNYIYMVLTMMN
jgi:hypothetical protein